MLQVYHSHVLRHGDRTKAIQPLRNNHHAMSLAFNYLRGGGGARVDDHPLFFSIWGQFSLWGGGFATFFPLGIFFSL